MTQYANAICVDIAMLLDLRLACAHWIEAGYSEKLAKMGSYYVRESDNLDCAEVGSLSARSIQLILDSTSDEILSLSVMTAYTRFLQELLKVQTDLALASPISPIQVVDINIHPYSLDEKTRSELCAAVKYNLLPHEVEVNVVSIKDAQLNAAYIKDRYMALSLYNPANWIESNKDELLKGEYRHLTLYTPRINHVRDLTREEREELNRLSVVDLFDLFRDSMKAYIRLEYIPVAAVSANTPVNPKHTFRKHLWG